MKQHIPNIITLGNLFCGTAAAVAVMDHKVITAITLVFVCLLLDFADGLVARALGVHSDLGKQLDSLADMVSFGVVPSLILFKIIYTGNQGVSYQYWLAAPAFLVAVFSGLRLAIFNLDTRQADTFIGLPTPASTIFVVGLWWWFEQYMWYFQFSPILHIIIPVLCFLLVSPLRLVSNKFKGRGWAGNEARYLLGGVGVLAVLFGGVYAFAPMVLLYVAVSVVSHFFAKAQ